MIELYFDGFCMTNPGTSGGCGVLILEDGEIIKTISSKIVGSNISNNIAEYKGLILGLQYLLNSSLENEEINIFGDSKLVIMQMIGQWKIKKGLYKDVALEAKELLKKFSNINFKWIPREENEEADSLSQVV